MVPVIVVPVIVVPVADGNGGKGCGTGFGVDETEDVRLHTWNRNYVLRLFNCIQHRIMQLH